MANDSSSESSSHITRAEFEEEIVSDSPHRNFNELSDLEIRYDFNKSNLKSISDRDKEFNTLLHEFVLDFHRKTELKSSLKESFYKCIMILLFAGLLIPVLVLILNGLFGKFTDTAFVIAIISSFVELIVAFLHLPKIIAQYLFNTDEDAQLIDIIKSMQEYNDHRHNHLSDSSPSDSSSQEHSQDN